MFMYIFTLLGMQFFANKLHFDEDGYAVNHEEVSTEACQLAYSDSHSRPPSTHLRAPHIRQALTFVPHTYAFVGHGRAMGCKHSAPRELRQFRVGVRDRLSDPHGRRLALSDVSMLAGGWCCGALLLCARLGDWRLDPAKLVPWRAAAGVRESYGRRRSSGKACEQLHHSSPPVSSQRISPFLLDPCLFRS
jgi:hypothetical protein